MNNKLTAMSTENQKWRFFLSHLKTLCIAIGFLSVYSCDDDPVIIEHDLTPYELVVADFPAPNIPEDNQLTIAKVELGRMLFYEKAMSKDLSQACADCHQQKDGFTDIKRLSVGVEGKEGRRQAMVLANVAWHKRGFFWDGRATTLREQALKPIQDPLEMNEKLENVISKLSTKKEYVNQFSKAFGSEEVTSEKIALSLEQFMLTIVSHESKYDQFLLGQVALSDSELRGKELFFGEKGPGGQKGGECFHCHSGFNFTNDDYMNNGLDTDAGFADLGRFEVTKIDEDKAKFKTPSLRNIAVTAPYMHDGRMKNLQDVIRHYNQGVRNSSTVDQILFHNLAPGGLGLNENDINDLVAFLNTLTDQKYLTNPKYQSPF